MIDESTIQAIKERANLLEVVREHVQLKRQGSSFVGLCPFHSERTPSFHVHEHDRFYHCFGCGASGNVLSFLMQIRGISFVEAVEELAGRFGIEVKRTGSSARGAPRKARPELFDINKLAAQFYVAQLASAPDTVKSYVQQRGLEARILQAYGVGFAPAERGALLQFMRQRRVRDEDLLAVGLVRRSQRGDLYETFRGRIVFPVWLDNRRIAGFGGRIVPALYDEQARATIPKYLNSPETELYQKSKILFGVPQALPAIRAAGTVHLVEGYMDVLALAQTGVQNVVATCGTALTERHVARLRHMVRRVVVLFDGDVAGRSAAAKSFKLFINSGLDARAVFLPDGSDPDDLARTHGEQTANALAELPHELLIDTYLDGLLRQYGADQASQLGPALKGRLCSELVATLRLIENSIERSEHYERAALRLKVARDELERLSTDEKAAPATAPLRPSESAPESLHEAKRQRLDQLPKLDRELLYACMAHKEELCPAALRSPDLMESVHPATRAFLQRLQEIAGNASLSEEQRREQTRTLLRELGSSWIEHWRRAYDMLQDRSVDLRALFEECARSAKRQKLQRAAAALDERIRSCADETERLLLAKERVELSKTLSSM